LVEEEKQRNLGYKLYKALQVHGGWAQPQGYPVQLFGPWTRGEARPHPRRQVNNTRFFLETIDGERMYIRVQGETASRARIANVKGINRSTLGQPIVGHPRPSIVAVTFGEDVPLKRFECSPAALLSIQTVTGIANTREQVLDSVRFQAGNAAGVAAKVASQLHVPDSTLASVFYNAFAVTHDSVPSWARPGGWTHGRIVRQRFLGARHLLKSGSFLYSCWGRPRGAGGPDTNPDYLVLALPGQYWLALGRRYWQAYTNSDIDTTTHAFLFAALRAYYGPLLSDSPLAQRPYVRNLGNIHCYIQFVINLLNTKLLDWVEADCPKTA
jgi:hypothetical protein